MSDIQHLLELDDLIEPHNFQQEYLRIENILIQHALEINLVKQDSQMAVSNWQLQQQSFKLQFQEFKDCVRKQFEDLNTLSHHGTHVIVNDLDELQPLQIATTEIQSKELHRKSLYSQIPAASDILQFEPQPASQHSENFDVADYHIKVSQLEKKIKQLNYKTMTKLVMVNLQQDNEFKDSILKSQKEQYVDLVDTKLTQFKLAIDLKFSDQSVFLHNITQSMRRLDGLVIQYKDTVSIIKQQSIETQRLSIQRSEIIIDSFEKLKESLTNKFYILQLQQVETDNIVQLLKNTQQVMNLVIKKSELDIDNIIKNLSLLSSKEMIDVMKQQFMAKIQQNYELHAADSLKVQENLQKSLQDQIKKSKDTLQIYINTQITEKNQLLKIQEAQARELQFKLDLEHKIRMLPTQQITQDYSNDFLIKMKMIIEVMQQMLIECKKIQIQKVHCNNSPNETYNFTSRRESRQILNQQVAQQKRETSNPTEENEFDDKKLFKEMIVKKTLLVVGQGIKQKEGISGRNPDIKIDRLKLDSLQQEITQLAARMEVQQSIKTNDNIMEQDNEKQQIQAYKQLRSHSGSRQEPHRVSQKNNRRQLIKQNQTLLFFEP